MSIRRAPVYQNVNSLPAPHFRFGNLPNSRSSTFELIRTNFPNVGHIRPRMSRAPVAISGGSFSICTGFRNSQKSAGFIRITTLRMVVLNNGYALRGTTRPCSAEGFSLYAPPATSFQPPAWVSASGIQVSGGYCARLLIRRSSAVGIPSDV